MEGREKSGGISCQTEPVPWILRRQHSEPLASQPTRQCLEQRFAYSASSVPISEDRPVETRSRNRLFSMRLPSISSITNSQPQEALRQGQKRMQRAFHEVASTFDLLSQRLRRSTRRRYRLTDSPFTPSPVMPAGRARLRSSPGQQRLYSPFGIETPGDRRRGCANGALDVTPPVPPPRRRRALHNMTNTAGGGLRSPRRKGPAPHSGPSPSQRRALGPAWAPPSDGFHSPTGRLRRDVARAERGGRELHRVAASVGRRSFRL